MKIIKHEQYGLLEKSLPEKILCDDSNYITDLNLFTKIYLRGI